MKESVRTALGWIRASLENFEELKENLFEGYDFHIHFPAAAIPKVVIFIN